MDLPDERAQRLLAKAGDRVRPVAPFCLTLRPGLTVIWDSPLFGELSGEVLAVQADGNIEVFHPLAEQLVTIPGNWVVRVPAAR